MTRRGSAVVSSTAVLSAAVVGARNGPQTPTRAVWYARLRKPGYMPPGAVIGGTWGVLEALLAANGYQLLRAPRSQARTVALASWSLTLAGLAGYPFVFFARRRLGSGAAIAGTMLAAASASAIAGRRVDGTAAAATVPLMLWLGFATVLTEELWRRNRNLSRD